MADSKRNSVGANRSGSSTPKPNAAQKGPAAAGPAELDFGKVIGARSVFPLGSGPYPRAEDHKTSSHLLTTAQDPNHDRGLSHAY